MEDNRGPRQRQTMDPRYTQWRWIRNTMKDMPETRDYVVIWERPTSNNRRETSTSLKAEEQYSSLISR